MRLRDRVLWVSALGTVGGFAIHFIDASSHVDALVVLGAGLVLGEILVMRLEDGTGLPLAYSVQVVIVASFPALEVVLTISAAQAVAAVLRPHARGARGRIGGFLHRLLVAGAGFGAFELADRPLEHRATMWALVGALLAVVAAEIAGDEAARRLLGYRSGLSHRGRLAWIALVSSGMLMAIGYRGVDGGDDVGIWGPVLFAIPLLAAWYAFDRLEHISRTYEQTLGALAVAPEHAGLAPRGHADRVASLALAVGREVGLSGRTLYELDKAARLHHLGEVTFEAPELVGRADPQEVALVTAELLHGVSDLAGAGDMVGGQAGVAPNARAALGSQVLQVVSAFDELAGDDSEKAFAAVAALASAPGYTYDGRVLDALERVVADRVSVAVADLAP